MTVYYIDRENGNDSNAGTSELSPWRTIDKVTTLADATPFTFKAGDQILLKAAQTHDGKKMRLVKQGGSAGWLEIGRYGGGADPIVAPNGTNDDTFPGAVISLDSCYRVRVFGMTVDAAWQSLVSCIGQKHVTDDTIVHALEVVDAKVRKAGQDGIAMALGAASEAADASFIRRVTAELNMDNGVGIYGPSNGTMLIDSVLYGNGNTALGVPDYGVYGGDGFSAHDVARNAWAVNCLFDSNRDGIHHINTGLPSGFVVNCWFRGNTQTACKLMDYAAAATSVPQSFVVAGNLFDLPAAMSGNGGLVLGRDGDDAPGSGVEVGTGGVWSLIEVQNTYYNRSAKPAMFGSWKDHVDTNGQAYRRMNNLFLKLSTGGHWNINRRARTPTIAAGINGYNTNVSGDVVIDTVNGQIAAAISAGFDLSGAVIGDPGLLGDPATDQLLARFLPTSIASGVGTDTSSYLAALGVTPTDLRQLPLPWQGHWPLGCLAPNRRSRYWR